MSSYSHYRWSNWFTSREPRSPYAVGLRTNADGSRLSHSRVTQREILRSTSVNGQTWLLNKEKSEKVETTEENSLCKVETSHSQNHFLSLASSRFFQRRRRSPRRRMEGMRISIQRRDKPHCLASRQANGTQPWGASRCGKTRTAASTRLSGQRLFYSTSEIRLISRELTTRLSAQRRFYPTPAAPTTRPLERTLSYITTPASTTQPLE